MRLLNCKRNSRSFLVEKKLYHDRHFIVFSILVFMLSLPEYSGSGFAVSVIRDFSDFIVSQSAMLSNVAHTRDNPEKIMILITFLIFYSVISAVLLFRSVDADIVLAAYGDSFLSSVYLFLGMTLAGIGVFGALYFLQTPYEGGSRWGWFVKYDLTLILMLGGSWQIVMFIGVVICKWHWAILKREIEKER